MELQPKCCHSFLSDEVSFTSVSNNDQRVQCELFATDYPRSEGRRVDGTSHTSPAGRYQS